MIANKLANLTDAELQLMEKILHKEFLYEAEQNKTWKTKNSYERPFQRSRGIMNCIIAIKGQRELNKTLETRW